MTNYISGAALVLGATLITVGLMALSDGEDGWPIFLMIPGVLLFVVGISLLP